jgi:hypothetical protein
MHRRDDGRVHTLVDAGYCVAAHWIGSATDVIESYTGPEAPVVSGPVDVVWVDAEWLWRFAEADRL